MNTQAREDTQEVVFYHLEFTLGPKHFALPLENVERVVHAVEVTIPPEAPGMVEGLVNYKGQILPVIDISPQFRLAKQPIEPAHHFIVVTVGKKKYILIGHTVPGVMKTPGDKIVSPGNIVEGVEFLSGVITMEKGMMLIPDLKKLFSFDPAEMKALKKNAKKKHPKKKNHEE